MKSRFANYPRIRSFTASQHRGVSTLDALVALVLLVTTMSVAAPLLGFARGDRRPTL